MHTKVWLGNLKGKKHTEGLGVDRSIISMYLRKIGWKGVDWIHLA
jgi:hypothetical protein